MREMAHAGQLRGHKALVVGAGSSGQAAARLLTALGADVRLAEKKAAAISDDFRAFAEDAGVRLILGEHEPAAFSGVDLVVLSPGVRRAALAPYLAACPAAQVVAELELASWFVAEPIAAITGSNGKTTTTMLTSHALEASGRRVFTGGNIGTPLSDYVLANQRADVVVLEVSSFQLQNTASFRPRVAALLNVSANHLDWHADMEEYVSAKLNLFSAQRPGDTAILPLSLRESLSGRAFTHARVVWFEPTGRYACPRLVGAHNAANMEVAALIAAEFGVSPEQAARAMADFAPPPHRIQKIGEKGGVLFVDDSKATTLEAMRAAITSFDRPVRLLAGGVFKGGDPRELLPDMRGKVRAVGLFGASREVFETAWGGEVPMSHHPTLAEAVAALYAASEPGDVILLSPATASFDLYADYKARGRDFQAAFAALPPRDSGGAPPGGEGRS